MFLIGTVRFCMALGYIFFFNQCGRMHFDITPLHQKGKGEFADRRLILHALRNKLGVSLLQKSVYCHDFFNWESRRKDRF